MADTGIAALADISTLTTDPRGFFAPYSSVVLVANSRDAVGILESQELGARPLFIFFNRVYRILSQRYDGDCMLISRSSPVGSSLVYRKELPDVLSLVEGKGFRGIINVRARDKERLSPAEDFQGRPVAFLDLADWAKAIYPKGRRMPSSGFAVAAWLAQQKIERPIYLAGFTGVREAQWRVFDAHDWSWEQVVLHIMFKKDMLRDAGVGRTVGDWPVRELLGYFGDITYDDFHVASAEALSHRLGGTNRVIDHIYSSLKVQLAVRDFFRRIRPRSRKARTRDRLLKEQQQNEGG